MWSSMTRLQKKRCLTLESLSNTSHYINICIYHLHTFTFFHFNPLPFFNLLLFLSQFTFFQYPQQKQFNISFRQFFIIKN